MTADANNLRPSYMQAMERICKVTEEQVADLTDELADIYPMGLIVYYEEYIKLLQAKVKTYIGTMEVAESCSHRHRSQQSRSGANSAAASPFFVLFIIAL